MMASTTRRSSPAADVAVLLTIGIALGLAYNALGLREGNAWGIAWKGVDLVKDLEQGPVVEAIIHGPRLKYPWPDGTRQAQPIPFYRRFTLFARRRPRPRSPWRRTGFRRR